MSVQKIRPHRRGQRPITSKFARTLGIRFIFLIFNFSISIILIFICIFIWISFEFHQICNSEISVDPSHRFQHHFQHQVSHIRQISHKLHFPKKLIMVQSYWKICRVVYNYQNSIIWIQHSKFAFYPSPPFGDKTS